MDLLKLNVAPLAVFQMLKSMCAGQRLASEPQDPAAAPLPTPGVPETRGQSRARAAGRGTGAERGQRLAPRGLGPEWPGPSVPLVPGQAGPIQGLAPWAPVPSFDFAATFEGALPDREDTGWETQAG